MEYKELLGYCITLLQGLVIYVFATHKKEMKEDISKLEKEIEKIKTGEFVEKIVKNVIYSPESRRYFKGIFTEALNHKVKNDDSVNIAILNHIESIEKQLKENGKSL